MTKTKNIPVNQVYYQGRWVSRDHFRAFVYSANDQKLANSYDEYTNLIGSGLWFGSQDEIKDKQPVSIKSGRKRKNASTDG